MFTTYDVEGNVNHRIFQLWENLQCARMDAEKKNFLVGVEKLFNDNKQSKL